MDSLQYFEVLRKYPLTLKITDAQGFTDKVHYQVDDVFEYFVLENEDSRESVITPNEIKRIINHARSRHGYKITLED